MHSLRSLIKRHPLLTFVTLAYLLSWWLLPLAGMPLPAGPMLAALLVVGLAEGKAGLKAWGAGWCAAAAGWAGICWPRRCRARWH